MPRIGKHPLKVTGLKDEFQPAPVTITTIVHIPIQEGYWSQSMDVLKLFFNSLAENTPQPYDLMVFDNGSCIEVQDYLLGLRRDGVIQYLILSEHNLKKLGAMDYLFSVAPGEYVAFTDSDVYFLPGWLEESLAVLEAFPEAGQVSALPTVDKSCHYVERTMQGVRADPALAVESGELIPEAYIDAHRLSIGRARDDYLQNDAPRQDTRVTRNDISAYASAQDFQFVTRRTVIKQVLPLEVRHPGEYYDPIYSPVFEAKVDELGWWRLSTPRYLVHHMGNRVPDLKAELTVIADVPGKGDSAPQVKPQPDWRRRILHNRPVRNLLKRVYTLVYSLLFER